MVHYYLFLSFTITIINLLLLYSHFESGTLLSISSLADKINHITYNNQFTVILKVVHYYLFLSFTITIINLLLLYCYFESGTLLSIRSLADNL